MPKTAAHLRVHQFQPGHPGGPGRTPGSRNRLTELCLAALTTDFAQFGAEAIAAVRQKNPSAYLSGVISLLPKHSVHERVNPLSELSDAELEQLETYLAAMRANQVTEIDGVAEPVISGKDAKDSD